MAQPISPTRLMITPTRLISLCRHADPEVSPHELSGGAVILALLAREGARRSASPIGFAPGVPAATRRRGGSR